MTIIVQLHYFDCRCQSEVRGVYNYDLLNHNLDCFIIGIINQKNVTMCDHKVNYQEYFDKSENLFWFIWNFSSLKYRVCILISYKWPIIRSLTAMLEVGGWWRVVSRYRLSSFTIYHFLWKIEISCLHLVFSMTRAELWILTYKGPHANISLMMYHLVSCHV